MIIFRVPEKVFNHFITIITFLVIVIVIVVIIIIYAHGVCSSG
jgi:hypothetical protein